MGSAPRLFSSAWSAYSSALRSHPLTTNIVTSGCITVASDTIAQTVSKGDECRPFPHYIDPKRTLTMLGWGTAVSGFGMFHWFKFLERLIPSENITPGKIAAKVLINQVCFLSLPLPPSSPAPPPATDRPSSNLKWRLLRSIDGEAS